MVGNLLLTAATRHSKSFSSLSSRKDVLWFFCIPAFRQPWKRHPRRHRTRWNERISRTRSRLLKKATYPSQPCTTCTGCPPIGATAGISLKVSQSDLTRYKSKKPRAYGPGLCYIFWSVSITFCPGVTAQSVSQTSSENKLSRICYGQNSFLFLLWAK